MPAGNYRTPITIERSERSTSADTGERVDVWVGWIARRARVRAASAREKQLPDTVNTVLITHIVRLRSDSQTRRITEGMRIRIERRKQPRQILHIESVIDADENEIERELRCVERSVPQ